METPEVKCEHKFEPTDSQGYSLQCIHCGIESSIYEKELEKSKNLPNFIVNRVCKKGEEGICNIGYACDGCPYNRTNQSIIFEGRSDYVNISDEHMKEIEKLKKVVCYCCERKFEESEITKISATPSGKCNDNTDAEKRFVCKKCNHLKEETNV